LSEDEERIIDVEIPLGEAMEEEWRIQDFSGNKGKVSKQCWEF
jgi:hypothetical protein